MRFFSKNEAIGVLIILSVVFIFTFSGLKTSLRRARDAQRQADLSSVSDALYTFQAEFGFFPPSEDGKVKACKDSDFDEVIIKLRELEDFDRNLYFEGLRGCDWGYDGLRDVTDDTYPPYLMSLPSDPKQEEGFSYFYISNTKRFQLYSYLEGEDEENTYNSGVVSRNLACGTKICSFGKSSGDTPLDISIEDYERKLENENP
ncbi:hypothetical protein A2714_01870 [Candidatus Woesebacteria bacterium RIFCSPHIGHO2_01_FULL_38_9]|uniref:Type II secretion system protein GspG C-terminal domain-containing protein n=2 Tax=Candidatus Woeseibacteriota TaxID=1752722 RepID=A0A1F7Y2C4_9BACT|nr:MAG: hypothetical protein A2714_01870 [Candidatus Woesebacteria bacterium RIFCSPHIGHO2_01_FULL_38_9]OGM58577.1 MAG: hypothetical protein A3A75_02555 [Candidatus Woesebacteria bacterium RIFCSPLOWO2_01_FULL_39_10]